MEDDHASIPRQLDIELDELRALREGPTDGSGRVFRRLRRSPSMRDHEEAITTETPRHRHA